MRIVVKQDEINELKKHLLNYISNVENEFNQIDTLKQNLIWKGLAYNALTTKYDNILFEEKKRVNQLKRLVGFLDDVIKEYGMAIDEVDSTYKDVINKPINFNKTIPSSSHSINPKNTISRERTQTIAEEMRRKYSGFSERVDKND